MGYAVVTGADRYQHTPQNTDMQQGAWCGKERSIIDGRDAVWFLESDGKAPVTRSAPRVHTRARPAQGTHLFRRALGFGGHDEGHMSATLIAQSAALHRWR